MIVQCENVWWLERSPIPGGNNQGRMENVNMTTQEHIEMENEAAEWAALGTPEAMDCADRIRQQITADRMETWDRTGIRPWDPIGSRATEVGR